LVNKLKYNGEVTRGGMMFIRSSMKM